MKKYLSVSRALTWRYVIALSLVATLSTAAWISLHLVISEQKSTAALVNVSGRQRMLSQRTALFSNLLEDAPETERPLIRDKLKEAIDLMERSHHGLTHGDKEMGLPDTLSPAVRSMYFDDPSAIDRQVETYIKTVRDFLQMEDGTLTSDNPLLQYITSTAPTTLVASLDRMVYQYQLEGEASIGRLQKAETIFWLITLLLLLLEAVLIFRPFANHVRFVIGKLQAVTDELQLHQEQLEKLVMQRTADLEIKNNELAVSERRHRMLVQNSPFCIHEIDLDGRLQSMNRAGLDMMGLDEEKKICGIPYLRAVSEQDSARIKTLMEDAFNGQSRHFEFTASGDTPLYFKSCFIPIQDGDGKVAKLMGLTEDITERKRAEQVRLANEDKLREQKEFLASIFENALDAFVLMNSKGVITGWSRQAEKIFGWSREEAIGRLMHETIVPAQYREAHIRGMQHFLFTGEGTVLNTLLEMAALHRDGHEFPVEMSFSPIKKADGYEISAFMRDISERKRSEELLLTQKQFSDDIINSLPGIFYTLNIEGRFVRVNPQFLAVSGYTKDELDRMTALDFFEGADKNLIAQRMQEVFETGDSDADAEFISKSGHKIPYYFTGHRTSIDGEPYLVGLGTDITERRHAEESLRITASVFDTSQEAILITDTNNLITDVNPAFTHISGYSREEVVGRNPKLLSSGRHDQAFYAAMWQSLKQERAWRGEIWNRRKNGDIYAEMLSISVICDDNGEVQRHVGVFSDISYLKEHEAALSRIAHYDALTGIPNRVLLADRMKQAIAQTSREQNMVAVCYLDLDGFKPINDTLGHEAGDQVLIEVAKRLGDTIRGGDTVARLGGDEFVVLLLGLDKGEECVATLERLLNALTHPFIIKGNPISLGASIGVSIYPLDDEDPDTLLRHSDQAMYVAKQSGKNRFYIYDAALDQRARNQHEFVRNIRYGLEHEQFELYFQPKINLRSRQLVGAEALIRWRHPELGLLVPAEFLRHIENTELDIKIGEWVIATALAHINSWQNAGLKIEISINISAYHLESAHFAEKLRQQLARYPDIAPGALQIEVLETAALNDLAIVSKVVEACRAFGVSFALDDFGTGYSSLTYLSNLPVDVLKIDQSFVRGMLEAKGDRAIVQGIIALARAFGRQTVAEGIETDAHYQALLDMGCEVGQGYGIARPMPADKLTNWSAA